MRRSAGSARAVRAPRHAGAADLSRALDYPYERPAGSYLYNPGRAPIPLTDGDVAQHRSDWADRHPVLATGSNAAPEQLDRKFGRAGLGTIPVVAATVRDVDAVFAARVAAYGAIPSTLHSSPGTSFRTHLTLLDDHQLEAMNESEGLDTAYGHVDIDPTSVRAATGELPAVLAYVAIAGTLVIDGQPRAVRALPARARRFPAWHQSVMLELVAALSGLDVPALVDRARASPGFRMQVGDRLRSGVNGPAARLMPC